MSHTNLTFILWQRHNCLCELRRRPAAPSTRRSVRRTRTLHLLRLLLVVVVGFVVPTCRSFNVGSTYLRRTGRDTSADFDYVRSPTHQRRRRLSLASSFAADVNDDDDDDRVTAAYRKASTPSPKTTMIGARKINHQDFTGATARRSFVVRVAAAAAAAMLGTGCSGCIAVAPARADDDADISYSNTVTSKSRSAVAYRDIEQGFEFTPPPGFQQTAKPLPTHMKEVQFAPAPADDNIDADASSPTPLLPKSYQYGITVDPVRINSLRDFGTPQEVAARVVAAELNRDGVFVVTLMKDPVEEEQDDGNKVAYVLNYKSQGKRGDKRFVCKFYIAQNRLYALTAQCREDDYNKFEKDMYAAVSSFRLLPA